jgi:esterase/lipase
MKDVYLLSGLGADRRVFAHIDLTGYRVNHVEWIEPFLRETIAGYAERLLSQITASKPILIGVSFGGIMSIEIGKLIETEKMILISSAKTESDIPLYYKMVGRLGLYKLMPASLLMNVSEITYWFFGVKTETEKKLLKQIITETDAKFLKWAIDKVINWKNRIRLENVILIHGTADKILPMKKADYKIQEGGHLMIVSNATELTTLIRKLLS